ncbi:MAG: putative oxidoreductase [Alphaproteobacteria bacterium MarineAlpha11_Bin1]|nr:MAG: putative oxidoreductase [Alphaproteobacteria bacterium MarineAlpha11_Bin1]|tara:strand:+ start:7742 stop:8503 length:762 start_codon:yes stop_codon:yes gene_type:complete
MSGRVEDRVCIVTGAAQGIGATYALALATEGAKLVLSDIEDASTVAERIISGGGKAISIQTDVSDWYSCQELVESATDVYGRIDVLINNAAIFGNLDRASIDEISPELFQRVMSVNVGGTFLCAKAVVPTMRERGYGKIVNVTTSRIFTGLPFFLHYDASKGAVFGMTRALAKELGDDGIRVNAIAPGSTMSENVIARTDWRDGGPAAKLAGRSLKRLQHPEDLVGACLYFASAESDFTTGQTLVVDGGGAMW